MDRRKVREGMRRSARRWIEGRVRIGMIISDRRWMKERIGKG